MFNYKQLKIEIEQILSDDKEGDKLISKLENFIYYDFKEVHSLCTPKNKKVLMSKLLSTPKIFKIILTDDPTGNAYSDAITDFKGHANEIKEKFNEWVMQPWLSGENSSEYCGIYNNERLEQYLSLCTPENHDALIIKLLKIPSFFTRAIHSERAYNSVRGKFQKHEIIFNFNYKLNKAVRHDKETDLKKLFESLQNAFSQRTIRRISLSFIGTFIKRLLKQPLKETLSDELNKLYNFTQKHKVPNLQVMCASALMYTHNFFAANEDIYFNMYGLNNMSSVTDQQHQQEISKHPNDFINLIKIKESNEWILIGKHRKFGEDHLTISKISNNSILGKELSNVNPSESLAKQKRNILIKMSKRYLFICTKLNTEDGRESYNLDEPERITYKKA